MSAKHSTPFPLRRYSFIGGASTLLVVLVAWVAVRAVGPSQQDGLTPLMMQPPIAVAENEPSVIPWGSPEASEPASESVASSPSASKSSTPTPSKSTIRPSTIAPKPTEKATTRPPVKTPPTPAASFTARYTTGASWDRGFTAWVRVTNTGKTARNWTVTLTYDSGADVRIGNAWNAHLERKDGANVLTGGPLAPGASFSFGFEASKQVRNKIKPTGCTVDGAQCQLD
ncbi:cellulose binding domain-containing protein [Actinoplanes sp. NPDC026623]|uniref:cellulose binding domain-containing protein n=1 Tax=Actinoplanes sp. NPDC026623 TaxID=3155610 RepID=UPI0033EF11E9